MKGLRFLTAALITTVALVASAADTHDDGDAVPADKGVLIFKIERERTQHAAVSRRGAYQLELRMVGSSERLTLSSPNRLKGYVVPPGRYYIYSMRDIEGGMDVSNILTPGDAFTVEAGKASWVGTIKLIAGQSGIRVDIKQSEKERAELDDAYGKLVGMGVVQRVLMGGAPSPLDQNAQP